MTIPNASEQNAIMRVITHLAKVAENPRVIAPDQSEVTPEHLAWMCNEIIARVDGMPSDKLNRWIGFIQGALAAQGFISVQEERDRTRPIYHELYKLMQIDIPPTVERG
jgi:hypothetical protein